MGVWGQDDGPCCMAEPCVVWHQKPTYRLGMLRVLAAVSPIIGQEKGTAARFLLGITPFLLAGPLQAALLLAWSG